MKITYTRDYGALKQGETVDLDDSSAHWMIDSGYAVKGTSLPKDGGVEAAEDADDPASIPTPAGNKNTDDVPEGTTAPGAAPSADDSTPTATETLTEDAQPPAKSASKADWKAYATAHGLTEEEADGLTRDQLAERFLAPAS